jgi:hypothetical protein
VVGRADGSVPNGGGMRYKEGEGGSWRGRFGHVSENLIVTLRTVCECGSV